GVRSPAYAGDDGVRKFAFGFADLGAGFLSNDAMEVADHGGIGMRSEDAADPVAHGFVDGVFEGARTGIDAENFGAQQTHTEDVELLAAHVFGAHVDHTLEAEQGADGGRGYAMLTGAGFRYDAVLAHAFHQQGLAEAVVDFVRAGVEKIFALEINFRASKFCGQAAREEQRRRASSIRLQQLVEALLKFAIVLGFFVFALQFVERGHQRFRNVAASVDAETAGGICSTLPRCAPKRRARTWGTKVLARFGTDRCGCHLLVCLFHGAHGLDKGADSSRIFLARLALDARGNIHAPGMEQVDRLLHIAGTQAAGDDQLADAVDDSGPGLDAFPVESLSSTATLFRGRGIEQDARDHAGPEAVGFQEEVAVLGDVDFV